MFFIFQNAKAQITYTQNSTHSDCGGADNGNASVTVTSTNGPYSYVWNTGATSNSVSNLAPGSYSVTITDGSSNTEVVSFTIEELPCKFQAELYFTPNGDGINDEWYISGISAVPEPLVIIYDRNGQKVYESKNGPYKAWDGRDKAKNPLPDATYFYIIYGDKKDDKPSAKGSVSILR